MYHKTELPPVFYKSYSDLGLNQSLRPVINIYVGQNIPALAGSL